MNDESVSFEIRMRGVPETPMNGAFYYCRLHCPSGAAVASGEWFARVPCVGEMVGCACQDGDGRCAELPGGGRLPPRVPEAGTRPPGDRLRRPAHRGAGVMSGQTIKVSWGYPILPKPKPCESVEDWAWRHCAHLEHVIEVRPPTEMRRELAGRLARVVREEHAAGVRVR